MNINITELSRALRRRRQETNISLREVAIETKVSPSTLSRIENEQGVPDADTIARLAAWLDIPMERFVVGQNKTISYTPTEPLPNIVEAHLLSDKHLTLEAAHALANIFRIAYQEFVRQSDAVKRKVVEQRRLDHAVSGD